MHLKSSCVSPLDRGKLDGNVRPDDPCPILQQQVGPLETVLEDLPVGVDHLRTQTRCWLSLIIAR